MSRKNSIQKVIKASKVVFYFDYNKVQQIQHEIKRTFASTTKMN